MIAALVLGLIGLVVLAAAGAFAAWMRASRTADRIRDLEADLEALESRVRALARAPRPDVSPAVPATPEPAPEPVSAPAPPAVLPRPIRPSVSARPTPPPSGAALPDFATILGPKLLVATGAIAFVVFLALFVKYAWDNNWVGPAGRVLAGAVMGLGLLAGGLRLLGREYRPLGQGLAAAGLAGLYTSAYAAHGFYGLVPREAAGLLMLAITASAVLLAARLDARLLAVLAWIGAYLTPPLLSTGEDKALSLYLYLMLLAAGALVLAHRKPWPETVPLAAAGTLILYAAWYAQFFRPARFGVAALGIVLFTGLFGNGLSRGAAREALGVVVWMAAGVASVASCAQADRPLSMALFLLALTGLSLLARRRWAWAETMGVSWAGLSVLAWMEAFFNVQRASDTYLIAVPVAGAYLIALLVRGLLLRTHPLGTFDVFTHLITAGFLWAVLYRVLNVGQPLLLGSLSLSLAALYLAAGLAALHSGHPDLLQRRVLLGLAAAFVTLAIPVQLGLHGITIGWAVEGVLLLALGVRFQSGLARAGGYFVLGLAVLRLLARHLPLHPERFTPIFNPAFGVWLFVIAALAAAVIILFTPAPPLRGATPILFTPAPPLRGATPVIVSRGSDPIARGALSTAAVILFFCLATAETHDAFAQRASLAEVLSDGIAAQEARRIGGLAVSVLWTVFATGLLAGGLFLRSRPPFYSAYGLFALTAGKVVLWDLGHFSLPYRMMAFLALGLLLMAGAYLNLRFRERLAPAHDA